MGVEFELKYDAAPAQMHRIMADFDGKGTGYTMETTYYDTKDFALSARRYTLRRRMENGVGICAVKTPASGGARGEWECEADSIARAVPLLCGMGAPEDLRALTAPGVVPVCGARFTRRAYLLTVGQSTLELALDQGTLFGGGREMPLCEVEVELKNGCRADAVGYAEALAARYGLKAQRRSKFRRALALAKGESNG